MQGPRAPLAPPFLCCFPRLALKHRPVTPAFLRLPHASLAYSTWLPSPYPSPPHPRPQAYIRLAPLSDRDTVIAVVEELKLELDVK